MEWANRGGHGPNSIVVFFVGITSDRLMAVQTNLRWFGEDGKHLVDEAKSVVSAVKMLNEEYCLGKG